jgi:DUF4097 and DUF4098 domain-containing protein YvlB
MRGRPFPLRPGYIALLLGIAAASSSCVLSVDGDAVQETARVEKRFTVTGTPDLSLVTFNGSIEVRAWDRSEVVVEIEKRGVDKGELDSIEIKADQSGDRISVEARKPPGGRAMIRLGPSPRAKLVASVPQNCNVLARSGDGSIAIERVTGKLELDTGDGSVRGSDLAGQLRAHTADGSMKFESITGPVDIDSGDGGVSVSGKLPVVRLRTGDGSVSVRADDGSVMSEDWEVRTGDGSVTIELPDGFDADLDATSGGGSVRVRDLSFTVSGEQTRRQVRGKLGSGGHLLKVRTGDGSVNIKRS